MKQVQINEQKLESEVVNNISKQLARNEDRIRHLIERELIENDRLNVRGEIMEVKDSSSPRFRADLDKQVTRILNQMYDEASRGKGSRRAVRFLSASISGVKENTKKGGKIIIESWAGLFKHIEDLTFSADWKKRAIGDTLMGATGGTVISGLAIGFAMTIMFPAQAAAAIGALISASIVGSFSVGLLSKYKDNIHNILSRVSL